MLIRAQVLHTPRDPFHHEDALEAYDDGGVLVEKDGRIGAVGDYSELRAEHPEVEAVDRSGSLLIPGLVDAHVHYPQLPVIGAMGLPLLEWLDKRTLPEEVKYADEGYAREMARRFLRALAGSGTTSALVFGSHFAGAMQVFFEEAERSGLRIASGLVLADRNLREELHTDPVVAQAQSLALIDQWHGHGRLRYAVTPRFSLSCSNSLLDACGELMRQRDGLLVTSHLNETRAEKELVSALFPWADDYLATYERYGLVGERSVYAHSLYTSDRELQAMAGAGAAACHCPSSNMFLGSGFFPLGRHLEQGVQLALGSDVGAGTGPGLLKEGLAAYQMQMLHEQGTPLGSPHLLYLATAAGASALRLDQSGWFAPGKSFDAVVLSAPEGSVLEAVWSNSSSPEATLAAAFTLAREESVAEVYVQGERV